MEISHGSTNYGYVKTVSYARQRGLSPWGYEDCYHTRSFPPGNIRASNRLQKKTTTGWALCTSWGWTYNPEHWHGVTQAYSVAKHQSVDKCGTGEYRTLGYGHHYYGSKWLGGGSSSGAVGHTLPSS